MKRFNEECPRRSSKSPGHEGAFWIVTAFTIIANRFHSFCDFDWFESEFMGEKLTGTRHFRASGDQVPSAGWESPAMASARKTPPRVVCLA
jgi:hypothetical protein